MISDDGIHFPFKLMDMVTMVEDAEVGSVIPASSGIVGPVTKWSYSPLQAIPRNADALWNLIDTVYFSVVSPGHEILECLASAIDPHVFIKLESAPSAGATVRLSYRFDGTAVTSGSSGLTPWHIDLVVDSDSVGVLHSDIRLPPLDPPSRKPGDKARPRPAPQVQSSTDQSTVTTPEEEPAWRLVESVCDSAMAVEGDTDSAVDAEVAYLESELAKIQESKSSIIKAILARVELDERPNRKRWMEAEQNLLNLYDKRPPSSFQPSAASLPSGNSGTLPPTLNALGRVDASLPDSFKDDELCCCICGEGDTTDDNDILICDGCSFAAHQGCYFVQSIPDGQWFCQLCETLFSKGSAKSSKASRRLGGGEGLDALLANTSCCLCLQAADFEGGGLMKPTTSAGQWAHVKCATWVPEAAFPSDGRSIEVIGNKDREELRCSICKLKGGCPLQCAFGKCITAFHVSCAAKAGLLPEEKNLKNLYCSRHVKIQLKTSPCTSRLLSLRKQDMYVKTMGDKLIAPKIGASLFTPGFNPEVDAQQAFLLGIAAVHPGIARELCASADGGGFIGPNDLIEESLPLVKDEVVYGSDFGKDVFLTLSCCCECMRPIDLATELTVQCDSCGVLAHALCFDRAGVPAPNVDDLASTSLAKVLKWDGARLRRATSITCTRCELVKESNIKIINTHCVLCMQLGGIVMPVQEEEDEGEAPSSSNLFPPAFAHPRCLWWVLATSMTSLSSSPPLTIRSISSSYHFHPCAVCGSRLGCTVRCGRVGCSKRFHISCGFHAGAFFSVRSSSSVVAGTRDGEDEEEVMDALGVLIGGNVGMRRVITCWSHEQRGMKKGAPQLGRNRPIRAELVRWVPEGARADLIGLMNQVLLGAGEARPGAASTTSGEPKPQRRKYTRRSVVELSGGSEGEDGEYVVKDKRRRKRKGSGDLAAEGKIQTVRFVDGQEITCEDEDWEGGCAQCGKAWTDSRGQVLESICCDRCDQWFHFHCVGIEQAPSGDFVCPRCM